MLGAYWVKPLPPPHPARLCVNLKAALPPLVMGLSSPPAGKFSYLWDRDHSPHRTHWSASPALCGAGMVFLREGMTKTNHFPALSPTTPLHPPPPPPIPPPPLTPPGLDDPTFADPPSALNLSLSSALSEAQGSHSPGATHRKAGF